MPRSKALLLLTCLFLFFPSVTWGTPSGTQPGVIDLAAGRLPITPLTGPWHFHAGDNPAWSQPGLDDTAWKFVDPYTEWATPENTGDSELAWFRIRLLIAARTPSLLLQLPVVDSNFQLFANGSLIAQVGQLPPAHAYPVIAASRLFTIPLPPSAAPQVLTLALRLWRPAALASLRSSAFAAPVYAGDAPDISKHFALDRAASLLSDGAEYTISIIGLVVGAASLILFWLNPRQRFYLWLACYVLLFSGDSVISYTSHHFAFSFYTTVNLFICVDFLQAFAGIFLVLDLLGLPRSRALLPVLLAFAAEVGTCLVTVGHLPVVYGDGTYLFLIGAAEIVVIYWLLRGARTGRVDARLLLPAYAIASIPAICDNLGHFLSELNVPHADIITVSNYILLRTPFEVHTEQVSEVASLLGMLGVLIYHFGRTTRSHERLSSALQAAHELQYALIPSDLPSLGGLSTQVAYMAAEEVGGDFCQVLPRPDGSLLLVLGDVSGKGLRAAMIGTLCVGALRSFADESIGPAAALDRLNNVVLSTEYAGFVTCLCALVSPEGNVTLANAGHLSPYLNGAEISLDAGLPLGIVAAAEYTETTLNLPNASRLTLLSDGVVEARSATGELLGFDRTSTLSRSTASEIAREAQQYGPKQDDDITVLTLDWNTPVLTPALT